MGPLLFGALFAQILRRLMFQQANQRSLLFSGEKIRAQTKRFDQCGRLTLIISARAGPLKMQLPEENRAKWPEAANWRSLKHKSGCRESKHNFSAAALHRSWASPAIRLHAPKVTHTHTHKLQKVPLGSK